MMGFASDVIQALSFPPVLLASAGVGLLLWAVGSKAGWLIVGAMFVTLAAVLVAKTLVGPQIGPEPGSLKAWTTADDIRRLTGHNLTAIILLSLGLFGVGKFIRRFGQRTPFIALTPPVEPHQPQTNQGYEDSGH